MGYGQPVIVVRPFNHIGPGQSPNFAVPALAKRIVEARKAGTRSLRVGTLTTRRDFTDVRDVVVAYRLLISQGVPGTIYNVCSGRDVAISDVAEQLLALAHADLELVIDPDLVRPVDVPGAAGRRQPACRRPRGGRRPSRSRQRSPTSWPPGRRTDGERCRPGSSAGCSGSGDPLADLAPHLAGLLEGLRGQLGDGGGELLLQRLDAGLDELRRALQQIVELL